MSYGEVRKKRARSTAAVVPTREQTPEEGARIDRYSPTWRFLVSFLQNAQHQDSRVIAKRGLDMVSTEHHRGRISLAEEILALAKPPPQLEKAHAGFGEGPQFGGPDDE